MTVTTPGAGAVAADRLPFDGARRALGRLLKDAARPRVRLLVGFAVFQVIVTATALAQPALNAEIIDEGIMRGDLPVIERTGLLMLAVAAANLIASLGAMFVGSQMSSSMARDLRARVHAKVESFGDAEIARFGVPSLLTRSTSDVGNVQALAHSGLTIAVTAPFVLVGSVILSVGQGWRMSPVVIVSGIVLMIVVGILVQRMMPWVRRLQYRVDDTNGVLREQLAGQRIIRIFLRERAETERFGRVNDELAHTALQIGRWQTAILPLVTIIANLASVAVLALGARLVENGSLQIGQLAATTGYLMQILSAVSMLTVMAALVPRAAVSAGRICEVLDTDLEVTESDAPDAPTPGLDDPGPRIEFRAAHYRFDGAAADVVADLSVICREGRTTAFIGGTGSGKSTVLSMLPRMIDPGSGEIAWNGVPITRFSPTVIRARMAYVPQGPALVAGTVAHNLRLGRPDADDDELWAALRTASAADFVAARADGLEAKVSTSGTNFSGGQRQRLALARALLRRPSLYVLDDPFSALDTDTEADIIEAMNRSHPAATVVLASQRVSSVRHADRIVVLDGGRITAIGDHDELMSASTIYRDLAQAQEAIGG